MSKCRIRGVTRIRTTLVPTHIFETDIALISDACHSPAAPTSCRRGSDLTFGGHLVVSAEVVGGPAFPETMHLYPRIHDLRRSRFPKRLALTQSLPPMLTHLHQPGQRAAHSSGTGPAPRQASREPQAVSLITHIKEVRHPSRRIPVSVFMFARHSCHVTLRDQDMCFLVDHERHGCQSPSRALWFVSLRTTTR